MDKKKVKIVIDSNVFANALFGGKSKEIFKLVDKEVVKLILSDKIFAEYSALIEYPKIKEKVDSLLFYSLLYEIYKKANFFEIQEKFNLCRDEEDNKFLDTVYSSKADCLITLDKDLLDLRNEHKEFQVKNHKFKILRPKEFLEFLKSGLNAL